MPHNWIEVIKDYAPANDRNVRVKRKDKVASEVTSSKADIPDNADQASSRNQNTEYVLPHLFQFGEKRFIFL